jgi:hypothetical protein
VYYDSDKGSQGDELACPLEEYKVGVFILKDSDDGV